MIIINILNILKNSYGLERVDVTSLQSVSGSGKRGLDDLLNHESNFYPYRIDQTCIPLIGEILDVSGNCGGYNIGFAALSGIIAGESAGGNND